VNAKDGLTMAGVALDAVELIAKVINAGGPADAIVAGIRALLVAVRDGIDGKTSPEVVMAQIDALRSELASNDAGADAALDKRFDP
jgi:hypothetical protein